jgi:hypothetical protein
MISLRMRRLRRGRRLRDCLMVIFIRYASKLTSVKTALTCIQLQEQDWINLHPVRGDIESNVTFC